MKNFRRGNVTDKTKNIKDEIGGLQEMSSNRSYILNVRLTIVRCLVFNPRKLVIIAMLAKTIEMHNQETIAVVQLLQDTAQEKSANGRVERSGQSLEIN